MDEPTQVQKQCVCGHRWMGSIRDEQCPSCNPVAEYTKGPWFVDPKRTLRIVAGDNTTIASTGTSDGIRDQWESNASLISCAPEMAEMLLEVLKVAEHVTYCNTTALESLLKKAGVL